MPDVEISMIDYALMTVRVRVGSSAPEALCAVSGVKEVDSALVHLAVRWSHGVLELGQAPR